MYGLGECAVCDRRVKQGMLMCGPHWRKVPKPLQHKVWAALDAYEAGQLLLSELRDAQNEAVLAAGGTVPADYLL